MVKIIEVIGECQPDDNFVNEKVKVLKGPKPVDVLVNSKHYIMGIEGKGVGVSRKGNKDYCFWNIRRVEFEIGEEKEAIKLFVDINREVLESNVRYRYKRYFYPVKLYKYFIKYFYEGVINEEIPKMPDSMFEKKRGIKTKTFCEYVRKRCGTLLKDEESLMHNCELLNEIGRDVREVVTDRRNKDREGNYGNKTV